MKKRIGSLLMLICLLALGLLLYGCATGQSASRSNAQMVITITDIPEVYKGMAGMLTLSPPGTQRGSNIAWDMGNIRSNNTFIGSMLDWQRDQPWFRSGSYFVMIMIDENIDALGERGREPKYTGVIFTKNITQETISISFEEFIRQ